MLEALKDRPWFDALLAWYFVTVWGSGFLATKVGLQLAMFGVVPNALSLAGIAVTCLGVALVTWRSSPSARSRNAPTS